MRFSFMLLAGVFLFLGGCCSQTDPPEGVVRLGSAALKFRDGAHGVAFLGDGKRFAMLNHNRIRIFETASTKEIRSWKADKHALLAIAVTPDGKRIASAGNNEMIRLWDTDTGSSCRSARPATASAPARAG